MKKTRLYIGITLVVQAFAFAIMFIILCAKKKSIAAAFLAVAAMEGAAGGYLLWQYKQDLEGGDSFGSDFLGDDDFDFGEDDFDAELFADEEEALEDFE